MTDPPGAATSPPQGTPAAPPVAARLGRRLPAFIASLLGGAFAAGLGLGALAVLVMVLWISSPFPDSGPGGALRLAASLWFLGHGTTLTRASLVTGEAVPLGLVPLLLPLLPLWLLHRAAREAAEPDEQGELLPVRGRAGGRLGGRGAAVAGVCAGYLIVAAAALLYARGGDPAPEPLSALLHVPPLVALAVASGVWAAHGRPDPLPALSLRIGARREVLTTVLRAASAAVLGLVAGGALLLVTALSGHSAAVRGAFDRITDDWSGLAAVLLLAVALVPNAVLWAASYGLGPGFLVGTGQPVALSGAAPLGGLPPFPLLSALPAQGDPPPSTWAVLALPPAAALLAGLLVGRAAAPVRPEETDESAVWSRATTALTAACAALLAGLVVGALATASAGPLGVGPLRDVGPVGWLTGAATFVWTAFLGVPVALGLRGWRLRGLTVREEPEPGLPEPSPPEAPGHEALPGRWWLPRRDREAAGAVAAGAGASRTEGVTEGVTQGVTEAPEAAGGLTEPGKGPDADDGSGAVDGSGAGVRDGGTGEEFAAEIEALLEGPDRARPRGETDDGEGPPGAGAR
ncbi:cell division protein PerM [Streptomyces sp. P6-2-1]|uniref:cell division protein PerM n=1 Tax=Streptomyces sp. P6-2-1 TaxID=3422591 RepID=UPI003D3644FC